MIEVTGQALQQLQSLIGLEASSPDNLIFTITQKEPSDKKKFRLGVIGGGCSGFQYKFSLEEKKEPEDLLLKHPKSEVELLVQEAALDFIAGATLDYLIAPGKKHFIVNNPNAASKCGCGSSFSL